MPVNFYRVHIELVKLRTHTDPLRRVLSPIGDAIKDIRGYLKDLEKKGYSPDHIDAIVDDETDGIEQLLGVTFVVCQTHITGIVSRIIKLHDYLVSQRHEVSRGPGQLKKDLLQMGSVQIPGSGHSQVEVINAFANYFKHGDEWPRQWKRGKDQQKRTAELIRTVGAEEGSTGNFRTGAEALDNKTHHDVELFADILEDWGKKLLERYRSELRSRNLL